jgi:3D (Asp-Asp-Asp) domain-containing protein
MRLLFLALLLVSACGRSSSAGKKIDIPIGPNPNPRITPDEVHEDDMVKIPDLLPTMYYIAKESEVNCKGKYGNATFNGTERTNIREMDGSVIANVCTRFARVLAMEGSAIMKDRGQGEYGVNYAGVVNGEKRFHHLDRCFYGEGVKRDLCLLPYHTIAADLKAHPVGEIVYVPKAVGLLLPDGSTHEGYFIVRDTGRAFEGIGASRVDLFTGLDPDYSNVFQRAGFHHKSPMKAFKIKGPSADLVKEKLRVKFGDIY